MSKFYHLNKLCILLAYTVYIFKIKLCNVNLENVKWCFCFITEDSLLVFFCLLQVLCAYACVYTTEMVDFWHKYLLKINCKYWYTETTYLLWQSYENILPFKEFVSRNDRFMNFAKNRNSNGQTLFFDNKSINDWWTTQNTERKNFIDPTYYFYILVIR